MTKRKVDDAFGDQDEASDRKAKIQLKKYDVPALIESDNMQYLCPVSYVYDYLSPRPKWLQPQQISLACLFADSKRQHKPFNLNEGRGSENSIPLDLQAARFPIHTGLGVFRQSKHWTSNEQACRELLELFAQDGRCSKVMLSDKRSMADLAAEQLKNEAVIDTYSRFSIYMFPEADKERIQLLAQSVVLIFMFDDVWENASSQTITSLRSDFVARIQGIAPSSPPPSPLEQRIDAIRAGFLAGDAQKGNAGAQILQCLVGFCHHTEPPAEGFKSVRGYLDYRWEDIANTFTYTCAAFSLSLSISLFPPFPSHLTLLLRHLGDTISIANDLASYTKERKHVESGRASEMINVVHVIREIEGLGEREARNLAWSWQLAAEDDVEKELEKLRDEGLTGKSTLVADGEADEGEGRNREEIRVLREEEWKFIGACLLAASGNVMASVVIERYGGEGARIA